MDVTPKDVQGKYSVFCNFTVVNPTYDSQTKENLVTPESRFLGESETFKLELPKTFTDRICKSDVIDYVVDYMKTKMNAEEQKALRKTQKDNERRRLDPDKYVALLNECFDLIKPEFIDGSFLNNLIFNRIAELEGFEYEDKKGIDMKVNRRDSNMFGV